jgi:hypothetical protein
LSEADLCNGLRDLKIDLAEGKPIRSPVKILKFKCDDALRERRERSPNPYAAHGWSRFG